MGSPLLVFPQMFLSGVLIPVRHASGLLALLTYIMPMTYSVDLARTVFYWGNADYSRIVLYSPLLDLVVTAAWTGKYVRASIDLCAYSEQNRGHSKCCARFC